MYVTYTRIYGWSDYGGESSYQPGYRLENMMWMTLLVYDYIIPGEKEERIIEIEIERLRPFKEHPFQVKDDKEMFLLQESIEKDGILNPLIVRPVLDGYYEIISGHRRKHAAEKLGYRKVPVP